MFQQRTNRINSRLLIFPFIILFFISIPYAQEREKNTVLDYLISITSKYSEGIEINADDNLFEVGISSLTLTEIMLEIEEEYPKKLSIDDLFEHPTLRQLSNYLNSKKNVNKD